MLKIVILLFFTVVSINCGMIRKRSAEGLFMKEIINTLNVLTDPNLNIDECEDDVVVDIFAQMTDPHTLETFCIAAAALQNITDCQTKQHNVNKLRENLGHIITTSRCTLNSNNYISLREFLERLLTSSRIIVNSISHKR